MHKNLKAGIAGIIIVLFFVWFGFFQTNFFSFIFQSLFTREINLKQVDGKINILLLGMGSDQADEPNLTDTIIFASINPTKNKVVLVSIPRDLWVPELSKYCKDCGKINVAYAVGGLSLVEKTVSKVFNQPISYGIIGNFNGFTQAVDSVGGLDINVDRTFDDYAYPLAGKEDDPCGHTNAEVASLSAQIASGSASDVGVFPCRYKHVRFDKGLEHMDGKTALEFVRSRHAQGDEGTDFARSARQEKVIKAFKNKILSVGTVLNPIRLISLYTILKGNIDTDIKNDDMDDFVRLFQSMKNPKIESAVIDYGDTERKRPGLLINPTTSDKYGYQWVLVPRIGNGNFQEVQGYVDCEVTQGGCSVSPVQ